MSVVARLTLVDSCNKLIGSLFCLRMTENGSACFAASESLKWVRASWEMTRVLPGGHRINRQTRRCQLGQRGIDCRTPRNLSVSSSQPHRTTVDLAGCDQV